MIMTNESTVTIASRVSSTRPELESIPKSHSVDLLLHHFVSDAVAADRLPNPSRAGTHHALTDFKIASMIPLHSARSSSTKRKKNAPLLRR